MGNMLAHSFASRQKEDASNDVSFHAGGSGKRKRARKILCSSKILRISGLGAGQGVRKVSRNPSRQSNGDPRSAVRPRTLRAWVLGVRRGKVSPLRAALRRAAVAICAAVNPCARIAGDAKTRCGRTVSVGAIHRLRFDPAGDNHATAPFEFYPPVSGTQAPRGISPQSQLTRRRSATIPLGESQ